MNTFYKTLVITTFVLTVLSSGTYLVQAASGFLDTVATTLGLHIEGDAGVADNLYVGEKVGVGTVTPTESLEVEGKGKFNEGIVFGDGSIQTTAQTNSSLVFTAIAGEALEKGDAVRFGVEAYGEDSTRVYKTNTADVNLIKFEGLAKEDVQIGETANIDFFGISNSQNNLVSGDIYYLSGNYTQQHEPRLYNDYKGNGEDIVYATKITGLDSIFVKSISLKLEKRSASSGVIQLLVYNSDFTQVVATSSTQYDLSNMSYDPAMYSFDFSNLYLDPEETYYIYLKPDPTTPLYAFNYFHAGIHDSEAVKIKSSTGQSWNWYSLYYILDYEVLGAGEITNVTPSVNATSVGVAASDTSIRIID